MTHDYRHEHVGLAAMLAAQKRRPPNLRKPDNATTAVEITRRAAVHHGTTPAQVVAFLRDEEKRAALTATER